MAAAAHGDSQVIRARKPDCLDNIILAGDLHDVSRMPICRELIPGHRAAKVFVVAIV